MRTPLLLLCLSLASPACGDGDTTTRTVTLAPYELPCTGFVYAMCPVIDGKVIEVPIHGYTFTWGYSDTIEVDITHHPGAHPDLPNDTYALDQLISSSRAPAGTTFQLPGSAVQNGMPTVLRDGTRFTCATQTVCDQLDAGSSWDTLFTFSFSAAVPPALVAERQGS